MSPSTSPLPTTPHPDAAVAALTPQPTDAPNTPPVASTTSRGATPASDCTPPPTKTPKNKRRNVCTNPECGKRFKSLIKLEIHKAGCPHRPEAAAPTPSLTLAQRGLGGGEVPKMKDPL
jgi:hypothetical protein